MILKLLPDKPRIISICANLLFVAGIVSSLLLIFEKKQEDNQKSQETNSGDALEHFARIFVDNFTASKILPGLLSGET